MNPLLQDLEIRKGDVVTIVGTGGKTTLLFHLAALLSRTERVLVTTTTKILFPDKGSYHLFYPSRDSLRDGFPEVQALPHGIVVAGSDVLSEGKLIGLTEKDLIPLLPFFDVILIEGDGSRGKPLKAWADHEPVVPSFTTKTIGVLPITALGLPLNEENVHNLELLPALAGPASPPIPAPPLDGPVKDRSATLELLMKVVLADRGLFKDSHGKRILLINQADDSALEAKGRALADLVEGNDKDRLISQYLILSLEGSRHGNHSHYSSRRPGQTDGWRQAPSGA